MAMINKDNENKWFGENEIYSNLKEAIKYFDDPSRSSIALVTYMIKDELNRDRLQTKMIKKRI